MKNINKKRVTTGIVVTMAVMMVCLVMIITPRREITVSENRIVLETTQVSYTLITTGTTSLITTTTTTISSTSTSSITYALTNVFKNTKVSLCEEREVLEFEDIELENKSDELIYEEESFEQDDYSTDANFFNEYIENDEEYEDEGYENTYVSEMTYYLYEGNRIGAAGINLISNYSVACNSIPLGTRVYIVSSDGSIDGEYRVDDTGGMSGDVIDIFFEDESEVPNSFRELGRVSCKVYIIT